MSGIVGSKLNIRGSGLVGSLGTDGQHLLSAGPGVTNVFETAAGGGKVLQVIQYLDDTARATTAGIWTDASSTLGGVITCAATSSKVLCIMNTSTYITANDASMTIFRDATNLGHSSYGLAYLHVISGLDQTTLMILDSPSSTSELTYQVKCGNNSGGSTLTLGNNTTNGSFILMEIGA